MVFLLLYNVPFVQLPLQQLHVRFEGLFLLGIAPLAGRLMIAVIAPFALAPGD